MDFTLKKYKEILQALIDQNYSFQTLEEFVTHPKQKVVVLRHDVDSKAINAIRLSEIERSLDIKASYYFRIVPQSNNKEVINKIVGNGNEIGYHYEDLSLTKGNYEKAYEQFKVNLNYFRTFYPVRTICMHGSPLSKIDNKDLWKKYDYKNDGVIAEPYFDIDHNEVFYITDTGRGWNKNSVNVRDKVKSKINIPINDTEHFLELIKHGQLPDKIILSTHPERWFDFGFLWINELVMQNFKNLIKSVIVKHQ